MSEDVKVLGYRRAEVYVEVDGFKSVRHVDVTEEVEGLRARIAELEAERDNAIVANAENVRFHTDRIAELEAELQDSYDIRAELAGNCEALQEENRKLRAIDKSVLFETEVIEAAKAVVESYNRAPGEYVGEEELARLGAAVAALGEKL
jgi:phage shock protein A